MKKSLLVSLLTLYSLVLRAQTPAEPPYTLGFIPASIEEIDLAFPLIKKWKLSGQLDVQW